MHHFSCVETNRDETETTEFGSPFPNEEALHLQLENFYLIIFGCSKNLKDFQVRSFAFAI